MERLLRRVTHILLVATWLAGAGLIWIWSIPGSVSFVVLGGGLFIWALRKGKFTLPPPVSHHVSAEEQERQAKYMVTQVLRNLTRVQVAYLCQDFENRKQGRAWLKQALPRVYHQNLDSLLATLETEKLGTQTPSLRLARAVLAQRQRLQQLEEELEYAHKVYPAKVVAHPLIFVVTEELNSEEDVEPRVITLAGWNTTEATLIPEVDVVAFLSESDQGKLARGHADLKKTLSTLSQFVEKVKEDGSVFAVEPVEDPARHGVQMEKVPMGFVIGAAELL